MEPCVVPELLQILTKVVCTSKPYCYVCLRTGDERRLVRPKSFKNFMAAIKVSTNNSLLTICHICERQSHNALKLFRAATFAAQVNVILQELFRRGIANPELMLESKYFKRILNKCNLSTSLTPKMVNDELKIIRGNSELCETDTLVMDNSQVYEAAPMPTVVAITTGQANINNCEAIERAIIQCPIQMDSCINATILPDREVTPTDINKIQPPTETYVILDDEDDPLRASNSDHQLNNIELNKTLPKQNININTNLVVTTEPPDIMTFQELLAQPNQKNINFLLHPIFLDQNGSLNIPSLSATITNDILMYQDASKNTYKAQALGIDTDIIKQSLTLNKEVFLQSSNTGLPAITAEVIDDINDSEMSNDTAKKMKGDVICRKRGRNNKSFVKNVQISDISSDMDNTGQAEKTGQGKTDWEDKIPMDVISFVDAVDPNAHSSLKTSAHNGCDMMQLGEVRSLATQTKTDDIIDLC